MDCKQLYHLLQLSNLPPAGLSKDALLIFSWKLAATVWASVFLHPVILFSAHPVRFNPLPIFSRSAQLILLYSPQLLNSAGILFVTQAILIVQPTHTPEQKREGAHIHAILNGIGVLALIGGLIIIEYNKISGGHAHFGTPHNIIGLTVSIAFIIQALVGIAQFYIPALFGGINNAKAIYKYHRASGYVILVLAFAAVATATQTAYNKILGIQLWVVIVASLITIVGIFPRIKKSKFGFWLG